MSFNPQTIYKVFLKNGQTITLKGRSSMRNTNTFEIYKEERNKDVIARFELSALAGVTFDKECQEGSGRE